MRFSVILGVCIVLCGAMVAQASLISITNVWSTTHAGIQAGVIQSGDFSYSRDAVTSDNGSALDKISIYYTVAPTWTLGGTLSYLNEIEGTWTSSMGRVSAFTYYPGAVYNAVIDDTVSWEVFTTKTYKTVINTPYSASYANYPNYTSASVGTAVSATSNESTGYSSFTGLWYASQIAGSTAGLSAGTTSASLLAVLYIDRGADLIFNATTAWGGFYFNEQDKIGCGGFTTAAVPEPATLALAASGLIGLLCYAWRKRRN